jgi:hypothetical protein
MVVVIFYNGILLTIVVAMTAVVIDDKEKLQEYHYIFHKAEIGLNAWLRITKRKMLHIVLLSIC